MKTRKVMKTQAIMILLSACMLTGCRTQQISVCENVKKTTQLPWLQKIVDEGTFAGARLLSIEKVRYRSEEPNTEGVGFVVHYEPQCCDLIWPGVYDCDGNILNSYGGIAGGCSGDCSIVILSREIIYTTE